VALGVYSFVDPRGDRGKEKEKQRNRRLEVKKSFHESSDELKPKI
jgi:hypothetical protein